MAQYQWTFSDPATGATLSVTVDTDANTYTVVNTGTVAFDLNAIWFSDADKTSGEGGITLLKSDSSLNLNGTGVVWDDYLKLSSTGLGSEGTAKSTYLTGGESLEGDLTALNTSGWLIGLSDADWSALTLGVRATSVGVSGTGFKLVDSTGTEVSVNSPAVISGDTSGSVTEAGGVLNGTAGTSPKTGNLDSTDVDNTADAWTAVTTAADSIGGYGTYTIDASGNWSYSVKEGNSTVQALTVGQTLTDTFAVTTVDGTSQTVTITINGANDAAVISGDTSGSVTEAGGVLNGTAGTSPKTGNLDSTDVDNTADAWTAVTTAADSIGGYGTYTIDASGNWSYSVKEGNSTVQALTVGQTLTDTFAVTTVDGTSQTVTITINGANDAAVISGDTSGSVTEAGGVLNGTAGTSPKTGNLDSTDVDNTADAWTAVTTAADSIGGYGTYTIDASGNWSYSVKEGNSTVQALTVGQTLTDTFAVTTVDGTSQTVTITINGANDAAVISGDTSGSVTEAGGVLNGTAGTSPKTGNLDSTDVDNTADAWTAVTTAADSIGGYGTYTIDASGNWSYSVKEGNSTVQALTVGQTLTDTFAVTTVDGTSQTVTITINGANDAAVISGDTSGSVTEAGGVLNGTAGTSPKTGNLDSTDVDNTADAWTAVTTAADSIGGYGTYTIDASGNWSYSVKEGNSTVQALTVGQTLTDTFAVTTVDGTSQTVTITINGANDAAVISGDTSGSVTEAGGVLNGTAGTSPKTGNLDSTDVDNTADAWTAVTTAADSIGGYGTYTIDASGNWSYSVKEGNSTVQALTVGQTLTDTFAVTTVDGTSQTVTITINGANDAAVISGDTSGSVTEAGGVLNGTAGTSPKTGNLDSTDVDNTADAWTAVTTAADSIGGYGTYTIDASGNWSYSVKEGNSTVQALTVGQTLTDTFAVTTVDGTSQTVTITINGANDAAVISGDTSGSVTEAGGVLNGTAGTSPKTGNLDSTDVDNTADAWTAVTTAADSIGGYGTYTIDASGNWSYSVKEGNSTVQALTVGQTLTDTFAVTTVDGTSQTVTITINGANDAAVISGDTSGSVTEAGGVLNGTAGTSPKTGNLDSTDVDNTADAWTAVTTAADSIGGYGTYTIDASGNWSYSVKEGNSTVQALTVGQTLTDTFAVTTVDGTSQTVTITINGANDAAVISGDTSGSVTEAGGVLNGTAGTSPKTGNLDSTDVDNTADAWTAVTTAADSIGGYGTYTIDASGNWSYSVKEGNSTVQALTVGQTLTDTFAVTTVDGTSQTVTITINGANDAAVISGDTSGSVTEAGGVLNGTAGTSPKTGNLDSTDVDNTADAWTAVTTAADSIGGYGTYTIDASGNWSYSVKEGNSTVQALTVGQTLTDTFAVTTVDGTSQTVTITINGANDAAVISGDTSGSVTEAGGVLNGTAGTSPKTGNLDSTDVDNTADAWTAVTTAADSIGGYGTYTIDASGNWSYSVKEGNSTVQALTVGQTLTDTFAVTTVDGTSQTVTITINGANDAAVISGDTSGSVTEAGGVLNGTAGTSPKTGNLDSTDVDNTADAWTAVTTAADSIGGYGTYTIDASGNWSYSVKEGNSTVQALTVGQTLTDTFAVTTVDGTSQTVTITINGANDAAVISGDTSGSVTEAGGVLNGTAGTSPKTGNLDSTDVDNTADAWTAVTTAADSIGGYGTYTIDASGNWSYSVKEGNSTVQALTVGQTLTDTFAVTTVDGTSQTVTITINGANDFPIAVADQWTLSNSVIPAGVITPQWFLSNDADVDSLPSGWYISNVTGLPAVDGPDGNTDPDTDTTLAAAYDGSGKLTGISGDISGLATGSYNIAYTLNDGSGGSATGSVTLVIKDTTNVANSVIVDQPGNDYSYIDGENGNDTLTGADLISGGAGIDYLVGSAKDDTISGSGGNDTLVGGAANDNLTGGSGSDWFLYNATADGTDVITDFVSGIDKIVVNSSAFTGLTAGGSVTLGTSLSGTSAQFVYSGGTLIFDSNGTGGGQSATIATLTGSPTLSATDFVII